MARVQGIRLQANVFTPEDIAVYVHVFSQPGALRAGFEDYRPGGTLDLVHDREDAGRRLKPPTVVLWGGRRPAGGHAARYLARAGRRRPRGGDPRMGLLSG